MWLAPDRPQGSVTANRSSQHTLGLGSLSAAAEPIWATGEAYTSASASASADRDGVADCDGAAGDSAVRARAGLSETLLAVRPAGWVRRAPKGDKMSGCCWVGMPHTLALTTSAFMHCARNIYIYPRPLQYIMRHIALPKITLLKCCRHEEWWNIQDIISTINIDDHNDDDVLDHPQITSCSNSNLD